MTQGQGSALDPLGPKGPRPQSLGVRPLHAIFMASVLLCLTCCTASKPQAAQIPILGVCPCILPMPLHEVAQLTPQALSGDAAAALELAEDARIRRSGDPTNIRRDIVYWSTISGENGGLNNEFEAADALQYMAQQYGDTDLDWLRDDFRAYFWANLAYQTYNSAEAKDFLYEVDQTKLEYLDNVAHFYSAHYWFAEEAKNIELGRFSFIRNINGVRRPADLKLGFQVGKENSYRHLKLNARDIEAVEVNALLGDTDAAGRLVALFQALPDMANYRYWLMITAEDGDVASMQDLATILRDSPSKQDQQRADFWAKRAASAPSPGVSSQNNVFPLRDWGLGPPGPSGSRAEPWPLLRA